MTYPQPHEEGVIRPRKGKKDPTVGPDAIMVMVASDCNHLVSKTGAKQVAFRDAGGYGLYRTGDTGLRETAIAGPFMGAPQAVMGLEKLIVLGAKRIWALGWCGSLQPDVRIGDLILPVAAVSEEGVSAHYPLEGGRPASDETLMSLLEHELTRMAIPFRTGIVWTTDAIYRETPEKIRRYQGRGVAAVDMELSAVLQVAAFRGVPFAALLVISDEIFDMRWRPGFSASIFQQRTRMAADVLIGVLRSESL